eukprot:TRINITY_DN1409_c1_g1_i2.p1 TRINITY_DN1409_c1_g1~~TRINITY_DN1409_c1_g1_i2.p1  ORF type:complete len:552 (-),score=71.37 TRINITY_DN1409_c1_g1_i2:829-2484(-)
MCDIVACHQCEREVKVCDMEAEQFRKWRCMETNETTYICWDCLNKKEEKPAWIAEIPPHNNFEPGCVVLAKIEEDWFRGAVWQYDDNTSECLVEFYDEDKGSKHIKYDNIKLLFTFDPDGDETHLTHKYESYYDALKRFRESHHLEIVEIADNLIPTQLAKSLNKNLDKIAHSPWRDFHPGSDRKVINLVHPSLYCYVKGVSMLKDGTIEDFSEDSFTNNLQQGSNSRFQRYYVPNETDFFGRSTGVSKYQWLPTDFCIDDQGEVSIQSYINGLTPTENFTNLYRDLEKVFAYFVPMLETVLRQLYNEYDTEPDISYKKQKKEEDQRLLQNCTLQVYVKAANYILQPEQTHNGVWHVEGVSQERIIATGIYYYEVSENMKDDGLEFRRSLTENEEQDIIAEAHEYPPQENTCEVNLGRVDTKKGRCIVFPNCHQHKLCGLQNTSVQDVAVRKILCFFVVDPECTITSTKDVHDQNWKVAKVRVVIELQKVAKRIIGTPFPEVIAQKILQFSKVGFSLEEAQQNRLALMRHRKYYKDEMNREIEREIDLCEH